MVLVVYNHKSGQAKRMNILAEVEARLQQQDIEYEKYHLNDWSGEIFELYKEKQFELIIVIGGDGSVKTCVNLIMKHMPECALKVIPAGSTNSFVNEVEKGVSIKRHLKKIENITELQEKKVDVCLLNNEEYFLLSLFGGYLARMVSGVEQEWKNKFGFLGYIFYMFTSKEKPIFFNLNIEADGISHCIKASTFMIFNFINLLGFRLRKRNDIDDGYLGLIVLRYRNKLGALWSGIYIFFSSLVGRNMDYIRAREVKVELVGKNKRDFILNLDGDLIGCGLSVEIKVIQKKLKILV